jgi:hypothetical protein
MRIVVAVLRAHQHQRGAFFLIDNGDGSFDTIKLSCARFATGDETFKKFLSVVLFCFAYVQLMTNARQERHEPLSQKTAYWRETRPCHRGNERTMSGCSGHNESRAAKDSTTLQHRWI